MKEYHTIEKLRQGVELWNNWREENPHIKTPFLGDTKFEQADLRGANLHFANFSNTYLGNADLSGANLDHAWLRGANLWEANLENADLRNADLEKAFLRGANLRGANFTGANLKYATIVEANIEGAIFNDCQVYGLSTWDLNGTPQDQSNLVITQEFKPKITVDVLEVAQFIYLLINNRNIRDVIDSITAKAVLILGRFTEERIDVLRAIQSALKQRNYLPILFDFEGPKSRDITETISTLAHLSRFIIADLTDAKSIPQELMAIVPHLPSVPIQPLILATQREYGMYEHFRRYQWVLETYHYEDGPRLIDVIDEQVIRPAETWLSEKR